MHLIAAMMLFVIGMVDEAPVSVELPPLLADSAEWPDDLKATFHGLEGTERAYCVQMMSQRWPNDSLVQGSICYLGDGIVVEQIVNEEAFIGEYNGNPIWVQGVSTENLADDTVVATGSFVFKVDGNERYVTVIGGSKTIKKLTAVNVADVNELMQSILMRRGYRLFRVERVENSPWIMAHVSAVSKTAATVRLFGARKSIRLGGDHFTEAGRDWLNDKENLAAMKQAKKEWDTSHREKPEAE